MEKKKSRIIVLGLFEGCFEIKTVGDEIHNGPKWPITMAPFKIYLLTRLTDIVFDYK